MRHINGKLTVLIDNEPAFRLDRLSDDVFCISGLPPGQATCELAGLYDFKKPRIRSRESGEMLARVVPHRFLVVLLIGWLSRPREASGNGTKVAEYVTANC